MTKKDLFENGKKLGLWLAGTIAAGIIPALLKGEELKGLSSIAKAKFLFHLSMPLWAGVLLGSLLLLALLYLVPSRKAKKELASSSEEIKSIKARNTELEHKNADLQKQLSEFISNVPRVHGVWNTTQTFWGMGRKGSEPLMQIGGWIDLTLSNTSEPIILLAAYIGDQRADIFMDVRLEPGQVNREMVMLYMVPPLSTDLTKSYTAKIVVEDQFNRRYDLPLQEFKARGASVLPERPRPEASDLTLGIATDIDLKLNLSEHVVLRIQRYDHQDVKGLAVKVDNNDLDPIQQIRVIVAEAQSFDAAHMDYRKSSNFSAVTITDPGVTQPGYSSKAMLIIHKRPDNPNLLAGNNLDHPLLWPENDKSQSEQWRFVLRVLVMKSAKTPAEKAVPLKEFVVRLVLLWNRTNNEFVIRQDGEKALP